jgi:hypothetical protein
MSNIDKFIKIYKHYTDTVSEVDSTLDKNLNNLFNILNPYNFLSKPKIFGFYDDQLMFLFFFLKDKGFFTQDDYDKFKKFILE